jgi:hypothetical protein
MSEIIETPDKVDFVKAFDFAADVRKFEIGLFWQRSLFFWGFITTAIAAYGAAYQSQNRNLQFAAAALGLVSALIWTLVNRGSLYWQRHWENSLVRLQEKALRQLIYGDEANKKIFIRQGWFWLPKHYSVSKLTIALSDFVVLAWSGLLFISSPIWTFLHNSPSFAWLKSPNTGPAVISAVIAVYIITIFRRTRPTNISN